MVLFHGLHVNCMLQLLAENTSGVLEEQVRLRSLCYDYYQMSSELKKHVTHSDFFTWRQKSILKTETVQYHCHTDKSVSCFPAARRISLIQCGLREQLLSERWGKVSLHIRKHPLQQDPQSLLEGSTAQDVHGRTEHHPDVGSPLVSLSTRCGDMLGHLKLISEGQRLY